MARSDDRSNRISEVIARPTGSGTWPATEPKRQVLQASNWIAAKSFTKDAAENPNNQVLNVRAGGVPLQKKPGAGQLIRIAKVQDVQRIEIKTMAIKGAPTSTQKPIRWFTFYRVLVYFCYLLLW